MAKSVNVYLPLVLRAAALLSTAPPEGLTRLATFMSDSLGSPLLVVLALVGSGAEVTVAVAAVVPDWALESVVPVLEETGERACDLCDSLYCTG